MSDMIEELDFTADTADGLERPGLAPGWYVAYVDNVKKDAKGTLLFKFVVSFGEHAGQDLLERLWHPDGGKNQDEGARKRTQQRRKLFAKRLRLVNEAGYGTKAAIDWNQAVGVVVAIQVTQRKYKDESGNDKLATQLDYGGVYPVDDVRVPEEIRALAAAGGTPSGARTPEQREAEFAGL